MKLNYAFVAILAALLIVIAGCQPSQQNTISVTGDSEIKVDPNQAQVWAGYTIVNDTAAAAQADVLSHWRDDFRLESRGNCR